MRVVIMLWHDTTVSTLLAGLHDLTEQTPRIEPIDSGSCRLVFDQLSRRSIIYTTKAFMNKRSVKSILIGDE